MLYNGFIGWICVLLWTAGGGEVRKTAECTDVQIRGWTVLSALDRVPSLPEKVRAD